MTARSRSSNRRSPRGCKPQGGAADVAQRCRTRGASFTPAISAGRSRTGESWAHSAPRPPTRRRRSIRLNSKRATAHDLKTARGRGRSAARRPSSSCPTMPTRITCWRWCSGATASDISILKALAARVSPAAFAAIWTERWRSSRIMPRRTCARPVSRGDHRKLGRRSRRPHLRGLARSGVRAFPARRAKLAPDSPIVHIEYANGLMLLDGEPAASQARSSTRRRRPRAGRCDGTLDVARRSAEQGAEAEAVSSPQSTARRPAGQIHQPFELRHDQPTSSAGSGRSCRSAITPNCTRPL